MKAAVQHVCSNCGNTVHADGKFCLFCGDVLAETAEKSVPVVRKTVEAPTVNAGVHWPPDYAGFWLRVWAGAIDVTLEALAALLLTVIVDFLLKLTTPKFGLSPITVSYVTGIVFIFVLAIGAWLYSAFTESSEWRATVGKRIIGLEVLTASGGRLSFGQATVRQFVKFLSLFTATVGCMMAGWTKRRQALHDMPSDCIVVRVAEPSLSLFGK